MSELGDKERRFVEDQRRVDRGPKMEGKDLQWHKALLEFAANHGQRSIDSQAPLAYIDRKLTKQDALLVEAAEVLRDIMIAADGSWLRASAFLDKLGERE